MIWLIYFEDREVPPEIYAEEQPALERFARLQQSWSCHLLVSYEAVAEITRLEAEFKEAAAQAERFRQGMIAAQQQTQLVTDAKDAEIKHLEKRLAELEPPCECQVLSSDDANFYLAHSAETCAKCGGTGKGISPLTIAERERCAKIVESCARQASQWAAKKIRSGE
jgi:hypothetical protein